MNQVALKKPFAEDQCRPLALNEFILESSKKFWSFLRDASDVVSAEEYFGVNAYADLGAQRKPTVYITPQEIYEIHRNVQQYVCLFCFFFRFIGRYINEIAANNDDQLRVILADLGPAPTVDKYKETGQGNEVALIVTNRFQKLEDSDVNEKILARRAKRLIFNILRVQSGKTLLELLQSPVTEKDEAMYQEVMSQQREKSEMGSRELKDSRSMDEITKTVEEGG